MEFLETLLELMVTAARAVWPGVIAAVVLGYLGWSYMGFTGFLIGSAIGAFAGTWIGVYLGMMPVKKMTGSAANDRLVASAGAFLLVIVGYFLLQFVILIGFILAIAALGLFWVSS